MSSERIDLAVTDPVPSEPPTKEQLPEFVARLWRACRALEARQAEVVGVVNEHDGRIEDLEAGP